MNENGELGLGKQLKKCCNPRIVETLHNKVEILGVSAGKNHSVFYCDRLLYTCGLNDGQLGHVPDIGSRVYVPKLVCIKHMLVMQYFVRIF